MTFENFQHHDIGMGKFLLPFKAGKKKNKINLENLPEVTKYYPGQVFFFRPLVQTVTPSKTPGEPRRVIT